MKIKVTNDKVIFIDGAKESAIKSPTLNSTMSILDILGLGDEYADGLAVSETEEVMLNMGHCNDLDKEKLTAFIRVENDDRYSRMTGDITENDLKVLNSFEKIRDRNKIEVIENLGMDGNSSPDNIMDRLSPEQRELARIGYMKDNVLDELTEHYLFERFRETLEPEANRAMQEGIEPSEESDLVVMLFGKSRKIGIYLRIR